MSLQLADKVVDFSKYYYTDTAGSHAIKPLPKPTRFHDTPYEITTYLQTLFVGKVIIAHDHKAKTFRILTSAQAEAYIERFFPPHLLRMNTGPYDDTGAIIDWYSPRYVLNWYAASDFFSKMEIRYPATKEEEKNALHFPTFRWLQDHYRYRNTTTTAAPGYSTPIGRNGILDTIELNKIYNKLNGKKQESGDLNLYSTSTGK